MKAKKQKLKFKPTPISRLSKMSVPFKMVGDPDWNWTASGKTAWESRQKAVYQHMIERKSWPMPWSPELWEIAHEQNKRIDYLVGKIPGDMMAAERDNYYFDWQEAIKENAAFDYHRDNFLIDV